MNIKDIKAKEVDCFSSDQVQEVGTDLGVGSVSKSFSLFLFARQKKKQNGFEKKLP